MAQIENNHERFDALQKIYILLTYWNIIIFKGGFFL